MENWEICDGAFVFVFKLQYGFPESSVLKIGNAVKSVWKRDVTYGQGLGYAACCSVCTGGLKC